VRVVASGDTSELVLASTPAFAATIPIARLTERGEEIRRARAQGDVDALARLELVPRHELERARISTSLVSHVTRRPWIAAAIAGLVVGAATLAIVLPTLSHPVVAAREDVAAWEGFAASYPFP